MNGSQASIRDLVGGLSSMQPKGVEVCVCPPYLYLTQVAQMLPPSILLGAQDCAVEDNGAFTGDISATMLGDVGAKFVILGHSERRQNHRETNAIIANKIRKAVANGLIPILCVGETEAERDAGVQNSVVITQLIESIPKDVDYARLVVAYEPIWAIGTGKTATIEDIKAMHGVIRKYLNEKLDNSASIRILYGGSVKADNAPDILAVENVDGALVGGASLKADQFLSIIQAA